LYVVEDRQLPVFEAFNAYDLGLAARLSPCEVRRDPRTRAVAGHGHRARPWSVDEVPRVAERIDEIRAANERRPVPRRGSASGDGATAPVGPISASLVSYAVPLADTTR
jgi:hypothetical protein